MSMTQTSSSPPRVPPVPMPSMNWPGRLPLIGLLLAALLLAGVAYWWIIQRVEVGPDQLLILVRKTGASLPDSEGGQVILYPRLLERLGHADDESYFKGILYEPRLAGRYFYDPFFWERIVKPVTIIGPDEIGIVVRKFGDPLPQGKTVATEPNERGPLAEIHKPGRVNLNPLAYDVIRVKPVVIPAGQVGVQTLLSGTPPADPNQYVVAPGEAGVQPEPLPPGMYYNNPYLRRIDPIDIRSQTIDLHESDAIRFPSNDSFEIVVDATVEYAIRQDKAPYVMVAIGDHDEIRDKLILPYARSLCRIEGSKLQARDFIAGDTRSAFQNKVFDGLRKRCWDQGIEIRATLIRNIVPPREIADPISERQLAGQQIKQYENEIKLAEAEAKLVEQQEMQKQNQAIGVANREIVSVIKSAEQNKEVALIEARRRLEVARLNLQAATQTAAATLKRGQAEAEVLKLGFEAKSQPLADAVKSFGDGETYAQYFFYQKLAPALKSVLASTDGPFAEIFKSLSSDHPPRARSAGDGPTARASDSNTGGQP